MPKIKVTDNVTGEVVMLDWTSDSPPTEGELRSEVTRQLENRVTAKEKIKQQWKSLSLPQRALAAIPDPIANLVGGVARNVSPAPLEMIKGVPGSLEKMGRGMREITPDLGTANTLWNAGLTPEIQARRAAGESLSQIAGPVIQRKAAALADVGEGVMGVAAPIAIPIGLATAPIPTLAALGAFGVADPLTSWAEKLVGIDPESGVGRLGRLATGVISGGLAGKAAGNWVKGYDSRGAKVAPPSPLKLQPFEQKLLPPAPQKLLEPGPRFYGGPEGVADISPLPQPVPPGKPLQPPIRPKPSTIIAPVRLPQASQVAPTSVPAPTAAKVAPIVKPKGEKFPLVYRAAKSVNLSTDAVHQHIKAKYGVESTKDLTPSQSIELVKDIRTGKVSSSANVVSPAGEFAPIMPGAAPTELKTVQQPLATVVEPPAPLESVATRALRIARERKGVKPTEDISTIPSIKVGTEKVAKTQTEPIITEPSVSEVTPPPSTSVSVWSNPTRGARVFKHTTPEGKVSFTSELQGDLKGEFPTQEEAIRSASEQIDLVTTDKQPVVEVLPPAGTVSGWWVQDPTTGDRTFFAKSDYTEQKVLDLTNDIPNVKITYSDAGEGGPPPKLLRRVKGRIVPEPKAIGEPVRELPSPRVDIATTPTEVKPPAKTVEPPGSITTRIAELQKKLIKQRNADDLYGIEQTDREIKALQKSLQGIGPVRPPVKAGELPAVKTTVKLPVEAETTPLEKFTLAQQEIINMVGRGGSSEGSLAELMGSREGFTYAELNSAVAQLIRSGKVVHYAKEGDNYFKLSRPSKAGELPKVRKPGERGSFKIEKEIKTRYSERLRRFDKSGYWINTTGKVIPLGESSTNIPLQHGEFFGEGGLSIQNALDEGWIRVRTNFIEVPTTIKLRDLANRLDLATEKAIQYARENSRNQIYVDRGGTEISIDLKDVGDFLANPDKSFHSALALLNKGERGSFPIERKVEGIEEAKKRTFTDRLRKAAFRSEREREAAGMGRPQELIEKGKLAARRAISERGSFPIERVKEDPIKRHISIAGSWISSKGKEIELKPGEDHFDSTALKTIGTNEPYENKWVRRVGNNIDAHETAIGTVGFDVAVQRAAETAKIIGRRHIQVDIVREGANRAYGFVPLEQRGEFLADPIKFLRRNKGERGSFPIGGKPRGEDPLRVIIDALKGAKPIREQQEALYTKERGKRFARAESVKTKGEAGFYAELGALKGELPKLQFESIRAKVKPEHIDSLFNMIRNTPNLTYLEKINARTGLAKLFGEYGGAVPQRGELALLERAFTFSGGSENIPRTSRVYPPGSKAPESSAKLAREFVEAMMSQRSKWTKMKEAGLEVANIPRSLMASFDLSAPFRQGVFLIGRPKQFWPAFGEMFKAFGSTKAFEAIQDSIRQSPHYELMEKSGLRLTELGADLSKREEAFMTPLAEKIPVIGAGVRASSRAYVGFLNKLRADVFSSLVDKAERLGLKPEENLSDMTKLADYVSTATGRGSLSAGLERAAPALNTFFFSPRLMASRIKLLNPAYYIKQPAFVRKEALRDLFSFSGVVLTILGLTKLSGAEVGVDPRSADFGKIKVGNTRLDIAGGFLQYIRLAAQLVTGKTVTGSGRVITLGEGYKPETRLSVLGRFVTSKEAPVASFATDLLRGTTPTGEKLNIPKAVGSRFVPMVMQDFYDVAKDDPDLLPLAIPGAFGVGVQTYKPRRSGGPIPHVRSPYAAVGR